MATAELTYANGIGATGVDAISRRAGVTKRTLYQHFRSKDELMAASLSRRDPDAIESLRQASIRRAARTGDLPVLGLFDTIHAVLKGPGARGCAFLNTSLELDDASHPAVQAALSHLRARRQLVADLPAESHIKADEELVDELCLLVDGSFAVAASRRDPNAALKGRRAADRFIHHHRHHHHHQET